MAPHANAARDEMRQVARDIMAQLQTSSVSTPTLSHLLTFLDTPGLSRQSQEAMRCHMSFFQWHCNRELDTNFNSRVKRATTSLCFARTWVNCRNRLRSAFRAFLLAHPHTCHMFNNPLILSSSNHLNVHPDMRM